MSIHSFSPSQLPISLLSAWKFHKYSSLCAHAKIQSKLIVSNKKTLRVQAPHPPTEWSLWYGGQTTDTLNYPRSLQFGKFMKTIYKECTQASPERLLCSSLQKMDEQTGPHVMPAVKETYVALLVCQGERTVFSRGRGSRTAVGGSKLQGQV